MVNRAFPWRPDISDPEAFLDAMEARDDMFASPTNVQEGTLQDHEYSTFAEAPIVPQPGDTVSAQYSFLVPGPWFAATPPEVTDAELEEYEAEFEEMAEADARALEATLLFEARALESPVVIEDAATMADNGLVEDEAVIEDEALTDASPDAPVAPVAAPEPSLVERMINCEEDVSDIDPEVQQWFSAMGGRTEDNPKRRRLTHKAPEQIPNPPAWRLKHAAASRGLTANTFYRLVVTGLPLVILNALVFLQSMEPLSFEAQTDVSEMYSGVGAIASAFEAHGRSAARYDRKRHAIFESMLTAEGFLSALRITRNTKTGGLQTWATVCSSWVCLCRSKTGRSVANPPSRQ